MNSTDEKRVPARKKSRPVPKGRQVDANARREVEALLSGEPLRRDLLIEHLHRVQDRFGGLSVTHLAALADVMRLSQAEVYEVASFYAHFDILQEGESIPGVTIRVCEGIACEIAGAGSLIDQLKANAGTDVRVVAVPCIGRCDGAPAAEVGHRHVTGTSADELMEMARSGRTETLIPEYRRFEDYVSDGGYRVLRECLNGERDVESVLATLDDSSLRGLGGAGFPVGRKWRIVSGYPGPRLMALNADEGEPGTFKDRHYLESDPHRFLEGMLIAAWAVGIDAAYIYVRDEYPAMRRILSDEIERIVAEGLTGGMPVELRRGAGAYICGEESAMIESIEGKRGLPRNRPPYVAENGLFGRPTLEHNVETLYWVPDIVARGAQWFASQGRNGRSGLRSYSVSGRVREPGVKLAPAGITAQELIDEFCGGMADGHQFKAYLPGGASGGILPATRADIPLDFGTLEEHGCFIGSAAIVVFSDQDDLKAVARNLLRFFRDESCGQCTPCRVGTEKSVMLMEESHWDRERLEELCQTMTDASICGLGQAAGNPIKSLYRYFPEELS